MQFENVVFIGTAKEFVEAGVMLNGQPLDQITIGSMGKHNLLVDAGEGAKPARGRTPKKYGAQNRAGMVFTLKKKD